MLIIGAKGFAKEILEICKENNKLKNLVFYDDISEDIEIKLYGEFQIIKTLEEAKEYFKDIDNQFSIGLGNPKLRELMYSKFISIGGKITNTISNRSMISTFDVEINSGCNILSGVNISNGVKIGIGCIIHYNVNVTHDCKIGDFVEISPSANLLGHVTIGNFTHIGSNVTILPNIKIGNNVTIGAGAVVSKDIPDNTVALGIPAKIIRHKM
ncbi:MAG: acetyltransferase [Bacteroidetes bacterium]|nr:acetyltransferase [Bacteroidota bacterium]